MVWVPPSASSGLEGSLPTRLPWAIGVTVLSAATCYVTPLAVLPAMAGFTGVLQGARVNRNLRIGMLGAAEQASDLARSRALMASVLLALSLAFVAMFVRGTGVLAYKQQGELLHRQAALLFDQASEQAQIGIAQATQAAKDAYAEHAGTQASAAQVAKPAQPAPMQTAAIATPAAQVVTATAQSVQTQPSAGGAVQ